MARNKMVLIVGVWIVALAVGCATVGRKLDESQIDQIQKGKTTKAEVLQLLGSPDQMTRNSSGTTVMMYLYAHATAKPATYIPIIGAFAGGANVQNQSVTVTIGSDGLVSDVISTMGSTESGYGAESGSRPSIPDVEQNKRPSE
jgi:outer membrane protein assembly factor BamE (lipoprotein component of BamABCDE complex)